MKLEKVLSDKLQVDFFEATPEQAWCIYGQNLSGIDEFIQFFETQKKKEAEPGTTEKYVVLSFARQQEIYEEELRKDDTDFLDRLDPGTPAYAFIENPELHRELINQFNLHKCINRGYRQLSSGESRKLLLLSALSQNPEMLIFEYPYDGVDLEGCKELNKLFSSLHSKGHGIIITVNNREDIPSWCTHIAVINNHRLSQKGRAEDILPILDSLEYQKTGLQLEIGKEEIEEIKFSGELVRLNNGFARYGETVVFTEIELKITDGQHTLISGPNGSGKSTLLQMIIGDNQNCYGNDLHIFGRKRGSGESIWELKKQMGIVSPDLHRNYYIPGSCLQVVLSGLFDSIGVYTQVNDQQTKEALHWLSMTGLADRAGHSFRTLPFAEQRLCLIARSLIKLPRLLILDEPTQGLDHLNRKKLLDFLEIIAEKKYSTILYASHRRDEFRPFFKQHLVMGRE